MLYSSSKNRIKLYFFYFIILTALIVLLLIFSDYQTKVEKIYSQNIYKVISVIQHFIFGLFPFSVGDIFYSCLIILLVYSLVLLIKRTFKKQFNLIPVLLLKIVVCFQAAYILFYLLWGLNYFRFPASRRLNLNEYDFSSDELKTVTVILIDSANICRERLTNADLSQSNEDIYKTAILAVKNLQPESVEFQTYSPKVKPSLLTPLLNYIGTEGYFNPFTGEGQINYQMPEFERPVVACHEMSHQMGFGAEDEANFVGFIAGEKSKDKLLRYSAYHLAVDEFMHSLFFRDSLAFKQLKVKISPAVKKDFLEDRKYWLSFNSKLNSITGIFYDKYLKVNNQPQGLKTYNRMVLLLMARYKNNLSNKILETPKILNIKEKVDASVKK